jgi:hypothetical protein
MINDKNDKNHNNSNRFMFIVTRLSFLFFSYPRLDCKNRKGDQVRRARVCAEGGAKCSSKLLL